MQKNFLRILHLGEHNFWKLLHDITNATEEQCALWQKNIASIPVYLWKGPKESQESTTFLSLLESFDLSMTTYNCASLDAEVLQEKAAKRTAPALHITCGFSETYIDILTANGAGVWFTGYSPVNSPWAALAELALFQTITPTLDSLRVSIIGAVDGLSQSLMEAAIYAPFELFMGVPPWGDPDHYQTGLALKSGAKIFMTREPQLALDGARLIYIDSRLASKAAEQNTPADLEPIGSSMDAFSWKQGFTLSPEIMSYALPEARILTLLDADDALIPDVDAGLSAKRTLLRKYALMASLAYTITNVEK